MLDWIRTHGVADYASIVGLAASLIGFWVTIIGVNRSKKAAESAENAANKARDSLRMVDVVVDFSSAIESLNELRRLHRQGRDWHLIIDRYAVIRRLLIQLKSTSIALTDDQLAVVQNALLNVAQIENRVESALGSQETLKPAKFNALLAGDIDSLLAVLTQLKDKESRGA